MMHNRGTVLHAIRFNLLRDVGKGEGLEYGRGHCEVLIMMMMTTMMTTMTMMLMMIMMAGPPRNTVKPF